MTARSDYPEHDKLSAIKDKSQAIGEFVDWLHSEKDIHFGRAHSHSDSGCEREYDKSGFRFWNCGMEEGQYDPDRSNITKLLAEFFEIDLEKIEREKRRMLERLRVGA